MGLLIETLLQEEGGRLVARNRDRRLLCSGGQGQ
jgi:hypothetical protein